MTATRAELARVALAEARAATARLVERIAEAEVHLDERSFDPRRAGVALEMLRVARATADAALRDAQEQADLTLDAVSLAKERDPEADRRPSGFQVPPATAIPRPPQRPRSLSPVGLVQQRKPTS